MIPDNVNVSNARNDALLHRAVIEFESLNMITTLLNNGANIHAKNHRRQTPLEMAIQINNLQAALLLIKRGALLGEDLNSLLFMAIDHNNATIVKMLVDHGIKFNPFINLIIPLNVAISQGQSKMVEHILPWFRFLTPSNQYIPREAVTKSGSEYKKCVELLLKWNFIVDPNSKNDEDFIYGAVKNGYLPIVLQLLELGINVNLVNLDEELNLLKVACLHKHHEIVENLLQHNAYVNVTNPTDTDMLNILLTNNHKNIFSEAFDTNDLRDITCLHIALINSDPKMIAILLKYGATIIDDPTFFKFTCIAVQNNCEEIVRMFLEHGVNATDIDSEGKSLLHFCVLPICDDQDPRYSMAKLLLEKGADVHIQTPGNSLLFEAIKNEHSQIAQLFLDYNADIQYVSPDGNSLLHMAIEYDFDVKFIEILLKRNSPVNAVNNQMLTPLLIACKFRSKNQLKIVKSLLNYNADVNCTDENLMTPLHFACRNQNLGIAAALLKRKANINAPNHKGETPLRVACE